MADPIDILKAMSDHGRLRILKMLESRDLCVCEITELIGLATSTVSSHLNVLKNAGLIQDEKEGRWINYRLAGRPDPFFSAVWSVVSKRLDSDPVVAEDRKKIARVDRLKICGIDK